MEERPLRLVVRVKVEGPGRLVGVDGAAEGVEQLDLQLYFVEVVEGEVEQLEEMSKDEQAEAEDEQVVRSQGL